MSRPAPVLTLPASVSSALSIRAKAMLFRDPASQRLLDHIDRIARSEATVLIVGETGTGKELVARHLHAVSGRDGPFVAVNCGAFSEQLIDAELFGHESGAYTGASGSRAGWFEAAQGGTLFLDEIGDLPPPLQVKLLRVLQERQVVRLGSRKPIALDVRLVAATNIDLQRAVAAQHFRADLYYRLSVAPVALPPLRARPGDILPLAEHFIARDQGKFGFGRASLSAPAREALLSYPWPGNIRELENVIHYALIVSQGGDIGVDDLRLLPVASGGSAAITAATTTTVDAPPAVLAPAPPPGIDAARLDERIAALLARWQAAGAGSAFDAFEAALVRAAFAGSGHNQVRSAQALGISRNSLRTLLKRHGLLASDCALPSSEEAPRCWPSDSTRPLTPLAAPNATAAQAQGLR